MGRTTGAIPGIGNVINGVTEMVLGSAVLVKNQPGCRSGSDSFASGAVSGDPAGNQHRFLSVSGSSGAAGSGPADGGLSPHHGRKHRNASETAADGGGAVSAYHCHSGRFSGIASPERVV